MAATPDAPPSNQCPKRNEPALTKRSVSYLTPEQLLRKRELDRESQRKLRERSRAYIRELETTITELRCENKKLREDRESDASCLCRAHMTTAPHERHGQNSNLSFADDGARIPVSSADHITSNLASSSSPLEPRLTNIPNYSQIAWDSLVGAEFPDYGLSAVFDPDIWFPPPPEPIPTPGAACGQVWAATPNISAPTCLLDMILINIVRWRRACNTTGGNTQELSASKFPNVNSLLTPDLESEAAPLASAIVKNIINVMTVPKLPEQIAILYITCSVLRWQISPTKESYERLAEWLRPGAAQIVNSHAAWIDIFPWPKARERACQDVRYQGESEVFAKLCKETISVNWPFEASDALVAISENDYLINPIFERHIRDISNWTLGQEFLDAYPEFSNDVNLSK